MIKIHFINIQARNKAGYKQTPSTGGVCPRSSQDQTKGCSAFSDGPLRKQVLKSRSSGPCDYILIWETINRWSIPKWDWLYSLQLKMEKLYTVSKNKTTQEKTLHMDITRWPTPKSDWLYPLQPKMDKFYTVSKNKTGRGLWLRSWTPYCQIQTDIEESGENH